MKFVKISIVVFVGTRQHASGMKCVKDLIEASKSCQGDFYQSLQKEWGNYSIIKYTNLRTLNNHKLVPIPSKPR